jgi:hypothetical protein
VKVVIVTMDTHVAAATDRARRALSREIPGLTLSVHAASEFAAERGLSTITVETLYDAKAHFAR